MTGRGKKRGGKKRGPTPRRSLLQKAAARGFRGYPLATVAFYGPDDTRATKIVVGIVSEEGKEPDPLERWFSETDARKDDAIADRVRAFLREHEVKSVVATDRIIGCPHEEVVDYPEGEPCPKCPFLSLIHI